MRKFFSEFKEFALKGNVINLAIGVIIGAAFQGVIKSLTDNILSPLIGLLIGQNFDELTTSFLGVTLKYGAFITSVVNFLLMSLVVFTIIKMMNHIAQLGKKDKEPEPDKTKKCPYCITEIDINATRCPACTSEL